MLQVVVEMGILSSYKVFITTETWYTTLGAVRSLREEGTGYRGLTRK